MAERWLIKDKVLLRPLNDGRFDELVLYAGPAECVMHAEMMDDRTLFISIYPPGEPGRRAAMWIRAQGNKLRIEAEED